MKKVIIGLAALTLVAVSVFAYSKSSKEECKEGSACCYPGSACCVKK